MDANGDITVTGGVLIAAEVFSQVSVLPTVSTQNTLALQYSSNVGGRPAPDSGVITAGTLIHVQDSAGNDLFTFAPEREYSRIIFSSPDLDSGTTYQVYSGGSYNGTEEDGLYTYGSYLPGSLSTTFISSGDVQVVQFQ